MKRFIWGVVVGLAVLLAIPLVVFGTGMFNVSAAAGPGAVEKALASWAVGASIYWRAPDGAIPMEVTDEVLASGLEHYRSMCLQCHGAPDIEPAEFAGGLYPPAPDLTETEMDAGELFWTIKNGIRMTGMPAFGSTHSDEEIWHLAALVQHLPDLTQAEKEALRQGQSGGHGHGGAGHHDDTQKPESTDHQGTEDDSHDSHAHNNS